MLTPQQLAKRRESIGASEIAALFHCHPFLNEAELWAAKVFDAYDTPPSSSMNFGHFMEEPLIRWAMNQLGIVDHEYTDEPEQLEAKHESGILTATCDQWIKGNCVIEAKWVSGHHAGNSEYGIPGTSHVPKHVELQVQQQLLCTGESIGYVVAANRVDQSEPGLFPIEANLAIQSMIVEYAVAWWNDHVVTGIRPETDDLVPYKQMTKVKGDPDKAVTIDYALYREYMNAQANCKSANEHMKHWKAKMTNALGDATLGYVAEEEKAVIRFKPVKRRGHTVAESTSRRLVVR